MSSKLTDKEYERIAKYIKSMAGRKNPPYYITVEAVGDLLDLEHHIVKQAFHKLNLRGWLDTRKLDQARFMGMAAKLYRLNWEKVNKDD